MKKKRMNKFGNGINWRNSAIQSVEEMKIENKDEKVQAKIV